MSPCPVCFEDAEVVEGRCFGCGFKRGVPVRPCTDCGFTSCPGYCGQAPVTTQEEVARA